MKTSLLIITLLFSFLAGGYLQAAVEPEPVYGNFVLFVQQQNSAQFEAIAVETTRLVIDTCDDLGRLLHVETNQLRHAVESVAEETGTDDYELIARKLEVSVYMIISIYGNGKELMAELRCVALDAAYKPMQRTVLVRGMVPANIPVKLARETAELHRGFPVKSDIRAIADKNEYLLNAGQWHGLTEGKFATDRGELNVLAAGRYRSRVTLAAGVAGDSSVTVNIYPHTDKTLKALNERLEKNILYRYGIGSQTLKGDDPEARFVAGTCIINMGANACLPGYGGFLSTEYLGFNKAELHAPGLAATLTAITAQFALTPVMTKFDTNFFPWIQDGDKTNAMLRLQRFLWASLPVTFTVGYFDQLAWQMMKSQNLPPFFQYKDTAAAVLSLLFPGGGLMYKGRLLAGWGYYYTEMALAGFAFYNLDNKQGKYSFAALGALKLIEIIHAFAVSPDYSFYKNEKESGSVSLGLNAEILEKENILKMGLALCL